MVNYAPRSLDKVFAALADPTRRAILARLARGSAGVTEVAAPFAMSLPAVSKHLRVLESAGLLRRQRQGRAHRLEIAAQPLGNASRWIDSYAKFWGDRLDALARYVEEPEQEETWRKSGPSRTRRSGSKGSSGRAPRKSSTPGPSKRR
ncbi:MAG TPA: metalloregulator ArsR/SmtB family transcription factor [Candidatus Eisenbacteria bacterium]|nr:metalloregulator ArsR/SmtB family transcription factor [Candidatus Eisenbacteria bacterium]